MFRWFLPTMSGDILLTATSATTTALRAFDLTPSETLAMNALRDRSLSTKYRRKPWAEASAFLAVDNPSYRTKEGLTIELRAPLAEVHKVLAGAMKPNRKLLSAVKFVGGGIEEIFDANEIVMAAEPAMAEPATAEPAAKAAEKEEPKKEEPKKTPVVAATVAQPSYGCPAPRFDEADVRASRVLEAFLDEDQYEDYLRYGKFVAVGSDTGHRYMVTNRERPDVMDHVSFRSLFDLDEEKSLCVHDWEVPPAEEMLAILFCVTLPGHEKLIREMPEVWHGDAR